MNGRLSQTSTNWYKSLTLAAFQMAVDVKGLSLAAAVTGTILVYKKIFKFWDYMYKFKGVPMSRKWFYDPELVVSEALSEMWVFYLDKGTILTKKN